jgi:predicted enzyme related to lactoylglutathione lyase
MINAVHMILYSENPSADRAFLRDVLGYPYVDTGHDWLIFKLPPAEAGVHPGKGADGVEMYFLCDDIESTLTELAAKGVETLRPVSKENWGHATAIRLPGGAQVGLYQPLHALAYEL